MTPQEQTTAKKTARIMRAARKQMSLTQEAIAGRLGISQSALSKLEHATLIPSAPQWFEFCHMTGIPTESLLTGYIEREKLARLEDGNREGTFKIPNRYASRRGSKVRAMLPFLLYFSSVYGDAKLQEYLKENRIDPDFLIDLDNQVSLEFCLDISRYLVNQKVLKTKDLFKLTQSVSRPEVHGILHNRYDRCHDKAKLLHTLVSNSRHYECNFLYRIEDQNATHLDLSVEPEKHLAQTTYRNDPILGDFLCQYKKNYFEQFAHYGTGSANEPVHLEEVECHYRGAPKCVYRIGLQS